MQTRCLTAVDLAERSALHIQFLVISSESHFWFGLNGRLFFSSVERESHKMTGFLLFFFSFYKEVFPNKSKQMTVAVKELPEMNSHKYKETYLMRLTCVYIMFLLQIRICLFIPFRKKQTKLKRQIFKSPYYVQITETWSGLPSASYNFFFLEIRQDETINWSGDVTRVFFFVTESVSQSFVVKWRTERLVEAASAADAHSHAVTPLWHHTVVRVAQCHASSRVGAMVQVRRWADSP